MTAFARSIKKGSWGELICEIKSVNHRYLEINLRLPEVLRDMEVTIRDLMRASIQRGKVDCTFTLVPSNEGNVSLDVNTNLAQQIIQAEELLLQVCNVPSSLDTQALLRWPGVLQPKLEERSHTEEEVLSLLSEVLESFSASRKREGRALTEFLRQRLKDIEIYVVDIREILPGIQLQYETKLQARFNEAKLELEPLRLAQEMLLVAQKLDVSEELDRLSAHNAEVLRILDKGGVMGKHLDFLMQELNREANTLSSKSINAGMTKAAVEIKLLIEQMREQIQNIE
ncbi:MAG: YicC/YloC family endoribonuclease [Gammaproteobacteria bacterium]|nr:YicC/YloC family endoribonuclease [Gammaproteobacteria bacterium]